MFSVRQHKSFDDLQRRSVPQEKMVQLLAHSEQDAGG